MTKAVKLPRGMGIPAERLLPSNEPAVVKGEKLYFINEVFYSLQGEGVRAGEASVFIRFRGCNLDCKIEPGPRSPGGFNCDTEFRSGRAFKIDELLQWVSAEGNNDCHWIVLTGGEPALQVDSVFLNTFRRKGYRLAIETNGTIELPDGGQYFDWLTLSPKVPMDKVKQRWANELKVVIANRQELPSEWQTIKATYHLISPAFDGEKLDKETLDWCIHLCLRNPKWRLSVQQHKGWGIQ